MQASQVVQAGSDFALSALSNSSPAANNLVQQRLSLSHVAELFQRGRQIMARGEDALVTRPIEALPDGQNAPQELFRAERLLVQTDIGGPGKRLSLRLGDERPLFSGRGHAGNIPGDARAIGRTFFCCRLTGKLFLMYNTYVPVNRVAWRGYPISVLQVSYCLPEICVNLLCARIERKTTMALETVKLTTVYVSDQDAALDFYVHKLGLEKRMDNVFGPGYRFLVVAPRGSETGIVLQAGQQNNRPVGGFTGIVFGASDVESTYQELQGRGVTFTEKPAAQEWGAVQALFTDPDGNIFVLHSH